jgi:hypothetical protein
MVGCFVIDELESMENVAFLFPPPSKYFWKQLKNDLKPRLVYQVLRPRFESNTFRINIQSLIAMPFPLVNMLQVLVLIVVLLLLRNSGVRALQGTA